MSKTKIKKQNKTETRLNHVCKKWNKNGKPWVVCWIYNLLHYNVCIYRKLSTTTTTTIKIQHKTCVRMSVEVDQTDIRNPIRISCALASATKKYKLVREVACKFCLILYVHISSENIDFSQHFWAIPGDVTRRLLARDYCFWFKNIHNKLHNMAMLSYERQ